MYTGLWQNCQARQWGKKLNDNLQEHDSETATENNNIAPFPDLESVQWWGGCSNTFVGLHRAEQLNSCSVAFSFTLSGMSTLFATLSQIPLWSSLSHGFHVVQKIPSLPKPLEIKQNSPSSEVEPHFVSSSSKEELWDIICSLRFNTNIADTFMSAGAMYWYFFWPWRKLWLHDSCFPLQSKSSYRFFNCMPFQVNAM